MFKTPEALEKLRDSKYLQKRVNAKAKRDVGFAANPFIDGEENLMPNESSEDEDLDQDEKEKRQAAIAHRKKMEAAGFTVVTMDDVSQRNKRGRDHYGTVVEGVTEDEGRKMLEKQQMKE